MLQTSAKTSHSYLRRLLVLPLIACSILIFSFSTRKDGKNEIIKADKKIVLVVDAGHGGKDAGGRFGTLIEKDLTLKIATRIKELSPGYNIEVHLTRSRDEYPTLAGRVDISNKISPDDFISIHIGSLPDKDTGRGNFNVFISDGNPQLIKSKQLGLSIFRQIAAVGGIERNNLSVESKGLYVLKNNKAPAMALSLGNIKNKEQMQQITNDEKLDELCGAILRGVVAANKK